MTYHEAMDKAAREYLSDLMEILDGNIWLAARIAGYDRPHFYKLLNRHGLNYWDFRPRPYRRGRPTKFNRNEAQDPAAHSPVAFDQQAAA